MKSKTISLAFAFLLFNALNSYSAGVKPVAPLLSAPKATVNSFGYFRAHKMANDIMLNWAVTNPQAVQYFVVERSDDNDYFYQVAEVAGNGMAAYSYRDRDVFPGYSWYRIIAYNNDGTTSVSEVEEVRIVKKK